MTLQVRIVSAEGEVFSGQAEGVILPGTMGEMAVYPKHAPLLTRLRPGEVRIQNQGEQEQFFYVSGGALEVQPDKVSVMADTAIRARDIDEAAAQKAKERAEQAMEQASADVDYARAQSELLEALARLKTLQRARNNKA